jgi:hypothetical protein
MKSVIKRKTAFLLTFALLLVAVVWTTARRSRYVMPVYGGKTAEEWFFGPKRHPGLETTINDARVAFLAMRTNCVPFLLDKAKTQETTFDRIYCWLHPKLPMRMRRTLRPPVRATYIRTMAYSYLRYLGSDFMADEILAQSSSNSPSLMKLPQTMPAFRTANLGDALRFEILGIHFERGFDIAHQFLLYRVEGLPDLLANHTVAGPPTEPSIRPFQGPKPRKMLPI